MSHLNEPNGGVGPESFHLELLKKVVLCVGWRTFWTSSFCMGGPDWEIACFRYKDAHFAP